LADAQRNLAWTLNTRQQALNRLLVGEALGHMKAGHLLANVRSVARVSGLATMLLIPPGFRFPEHVRRKLEQLLGEHIWFVVDTGNTRSLLSQALGNAVNRAQIRIEEKIQVVHVGTGELGAVTRERVRLAQQLTCLHIIS
jgi:hypothetical protein